MKEIALTQGRVAIVDDEDYAVLSKHHWFYVAAGYAKRSPKKRGEPQISMARDILGLSYKDGRTADHINGDKLDNRRENLRVVRHSQSVRNRLWASNPSGFKGVCKRGGRWLAQVASDGKKFHLGMFDTPQQAAIAYDHAALVLHGVYAAINGVLPEHRVIASRCLLGG